MLSLEEKIDEYYNKYSNYPFENNIIRKNQKDDAFVLLAAELLFSDYLLPSIDGTKSEIYKSIIPPPDDGIDIFFEQSEEDEFNYHIVQVKNSELDSNQINKCFAVMKRAIDVYSKNPNAIGSNLKTVISGTNYTSAFKSRCIYYVVHTGDVRYTKQQEKDEKIISKADLENIP